MSILTEYRPTEFDDMVGHDDAIMSLESIVERNSERAFLFCGMTGIGKTTLCRIVAAQLGIPESNMIEVDGATHSTVEETRSLIEQVKTGGFFLSDAPRGVLIDECARLSKQAFDALLKTVEEGPDNVYWFFATTEKNKVPPTLRSRCATFDLKPLSRDQLTDIVEAAVEAEGIEEPLPDEVLRAIVEAAEGSPRQALANFDMAVDAEDHKQAARLLASPSDTSEVIDLCRLLFGKQNPNWSKFAGMLKELFNEVGPDAVRETVLSYAESVVLNSTSSNKASYGLSVLSELTENWDYGQTRRLLVVRLGYLLK